MTSFVQQVGLIWVRIMKRLYCIFFILLLCLSMFPGSVWAASIDGFQWEISQDALLASLWETDIESIQQALELSLITCVELTGYYLERIETYNDTYNCFITLCEDAMSQAAERDAAIQAGTAEGLLFGIPMVIKDNMDYAGYHTTSGHAKHNSQIADSNAQVVQYLLEEGAVIIGKTNMSTDAQDARASSSTVAGETKNAYNAYMAAGGSSGGSAVATSLNFAVAGLGTDTNSSLRLPAVLNGCVSMRVTWGTLSMEGIDQLNSTRDVPGAITRTVKDQAIVLDVLSGGETNYAENLDDGILSGLRIGVLKELSSATNTLRSEQNIDDEVILAFANTIEELKACGAEVVEVSIPNVLSLADSTWSSNQSYLKEDMYQVIEEAMLESNVSALIFPTYLHTPQRSGTGPDGTYWSVWNQTFINNTSQFSSCASLPEIAIPIDYHSLGAGIGMEIATLKNQEQLLLDIAYAYSSRYDHRMAPVNAADLYASSYEGSLSGLIEDYYIQLDTYEQVQLAASEEAARAPQTETSPQPIQPTDSETVNWLAVSAAILIPAGLLAGILLPKHRRRPKGSRRRRRRANNRQILQSL